MKKSASRMPPAGRYQVNEWEYARMLPGAAGVRSWRYNGMYTKSPGQ